MRKTLPGTVRATMRYGQPSGVETYRTYEDEHFEGSLHDLWGNVAVRTVMIVQVEAQFCVLHDSWWIPAGEQTPIHIFDERCSSELTRDWTMPVFGTFSSLDAAIAAVALGLGQGDPP